MSADSKIEFTNQILRNIQIVSTTGKQELNAFYIYNQKHIYYD